MRKAIIIFVGIVVALIVGISAFLAPDSLMECSTSPSELEGCSRADAIVVVSGGDTSSRTQTGINLYENGWAPKLIFSGAAYDKSGPSNAEVMQRQALEQGVPAADISIDRLSENTAENAKNTASILRSEQRKKVIVVTSRYHMKRTLLEFRANAPQVEFRGHPAAADNQWSVWWWTTPYGWYLAVSELIKIMVLYTGR